MILLKSLISHLEQIAPLALAESWDNVGLLVGDPEQAINKAMLCIDYTATVAQEARDAGCDLIVAYHPPVFDAIKRVTNTGSTSLIYDAIRRGIALYSPHSALDAAKGGTHDMLADVLGLIDCKPLRIEEAKPTTYKLVTFVPKDHVEAVGRAVFDAGAGWIGNYSSCSFRIKGTGTFFGEKGSTPALGEAGKLEEVDEVRLETVVPIDKVDQIVQALRKSHPYEEPAVDLRQLAALPSGMGVGRVGKLPGEVMVEMLINRIKRELEISHVLVVGPVDRLVRRAAVGAGACGNLLDDAIRSGVDLYLTGEMRHHDALKAAQAGITVVCTLHSNSERAVLKRLKSRLEQSVPDLPVQLSQTDRDPFVIR